MSWKYTLALATVIPVISILNIPILNTPYALGAAPLEYTVDRIEGKTISFKTDQSSRALQTNLFELKAIGVLKATDGTQYFLFSGFPCETCRSEESIYAFKPDSTYQNQFVYPGKILNHKDRALLYRSRAFYGQCIPNWKGGSKNDEYVVFQSEKVDRRSRLQDSVFVAEATPEGLKETLIERRLPRLTHTLKQVRKKLCHEIDGKNRLASGKRTDITPRSIKLQKANSSDSSSGQNPGPSSSPSPSLSPGASTAIDEDDDLPPKENQTDRDLPSTPD